MSIFVPGRIICFPPIDCFDCSQAMIIIYSVLTYMHRILGDTPDFPPWISSSETTVTNGLHQLQ